MCTTASSFLDAEGVGEGVFETTWRQTGEKEIKQMENTCSDIQVMAKDRQMWKDYAASLYPMHQRVFGISE